MIGVLILNSTAVLFGQDISIRNLRTKQAFEKRTSLQKYSDTYRLSTSILWGSSYMTEGRKNLENDGILSFESNFEMYRVSLTAWYAYGYHEKYHELDLSVEYGREFYEFEYYVGYTRIEYFSENENDNEIISGGRYNKFNWLSPCVDFVYSTEANGSFLELSLHSEFFLFSNRLILSPYLLEGVDFGYASEEHDGLNNLQVGLNVSYSLIKRVMLIGSVEHSIAGEDVRRDGQRNTSCFCLGVFYEF